jgi:hypothetical protein
MQYQANPSTNFFQTSHVASPWVIYSPNISRFCGDRLTTKTLQAPAVGLSCNRFFFSTKQCHYASFNHQARK